MLHNTLFSPKSITVIGASNNLHKPGGNVLRNLKNGTFVGQLFPVNPKESTIQELDCYNSVTQLPSVDLAILAIPSQFCVAAVEELANKKNTRTFIILSAGFSETNAEGKIIEDKIVEIINSVGGTLIGPNCIGMITTNYAGVFTQPVPEIVATGVDLISGSGATAVFIMESGIPYGLKFANIFSVGNSAQTGIEDVLQHMDETFDAEVSPKIKLLYLEKITDPNRLYKHAVSLINKGCKIAALKAGSSNAGGRAAASHTGALASPDACADALLKKAGIVRCYSRAELVSAATIFSYPKLQGKNIAIITHAGGPAVILSDVLEKNGLQVPEIISDKKQALKEKLFAGASVENPIDFLATGTAQQLEDIIDACENDFDEIDAMAVIFGSPGLTTIFDVYESLRQKMITCKKPIYPIFPSVKQAAKEIETFTKQGYLFFADEVPFGQMLARVFKTPLPIKIEKKTPYIYTQKLETFIQGVKKGWLWPEKIQELFDIVEIPSAKELVSNTEIQTRKNANKIGYPIVMKAIGPLHKSDAGGVSLNIKTEKHLTDEFNRMMLIKDVSSVLLQPFLSGTELFLGATYEKGYGHIVYVGLGGIFVEILKDTASALTPISENQAVEMIKSLKSFQIIEGARGQEGVDYHKYAQIVHKFSRLLENCPQIAEIDVNPLIGNTEKVVAVDARILIDL